LWHFADASHQLQLHRVSFNMVNMLAESDGMPPGLELTSHYNVILYDSTWIAEVTTTTNKQTKQTKTKQTKQTIKLNKQNKLHKLNKLNKHKYKTNKTNINTKQTKQT